MNVETDIEDLNEKAMHMVFLLCMSTYFVIKPTHSQQTSDDEYGIILDGGSSGTKLKIYKWSRGTEAVSRDKVSRGAQFKETQSDNNVDINYDIKLVETQKFKPGISEIASKGSKVDKYIHDVLLRAAQVVPAAYHRRTPIYFMATAGLRTLSIDVTETLLDSIEKLFRNSSVNPFATRDEGIRVLSGEEEAVYAWVAANYLRGYFRSDRPPTDTVGVIEMGGGSTQISFLPEHSVYANMFPVRLGGRTYHLYAHSYLFYGQNYIVSRINDYIVAISGDKQEVENPCMLKGDNTTVMSFANSVHIHGSADVTKCLEIIDIFLQTADDSWCYPKPCAIGRTYQPPVGNAMFYAISAFIYAPRYLQAVDDRGRLNVSLLHTNAAKHCQKTLSETISDGLSAEYASQYCTMGLYIPSLLLDAYGFDESKNTILVKSDIDDISIDWALGAMLTLAETMKPRDNCEISAAVITSSVFFTTWFMSLSVVFMLNIS